MLEDDDASWVSSTEERQNSISESVRQRFFGIDEWASLPEERQVNDKRVLWCNYHVIKSRCERITIGGDCTLLHVHHVFLLLYNTDSEIQWNSHGRKGKVLDDNPAIVHYAGPLIIVVPSEKQGCQSEGLVMSNNKRRRKEGAKDEKKGRKKQSSIKDGKVNKWGGMKMCTGVKRFKIHKFYPPSYSPLRISKQWSSWFGAKILRVDTAVATTNSSMIWCWRPPQTRPHQDREEAVDLNSPRPHRI